eukprot:584393-Pyramimonas_sp.AAC.1
MVVTVISRVSPTASAPANSISPPGGAKVSSTHGGGTPCSCIARVPGTMACGERATASPRRNPAR